ncbi:MAG TPA: hypothetical protein PLD59_01455 [Tepidisphaeraceae bacterium]|nr:hypothetical protein [Tepidisphaeraceae bacterium]
MNGRQKVGSMNKLMLATVGVALGISTAAFGQARIDTGGALDRNNRIGSGGINSGGAARLPFYQLNNNIVTGNVTGGRQFRGQTSVTDPRAFRGTLSAGGVDRFVAQSAGPTVVQGNYAGDARSNAQAVRPFFGESEGVAPPPGFAAIGSTGGYVPAAPPTRIGSDLRLGNVFDTPTTALPRPGALLLPGAVDTSNNNTLITASPLYGVRGLNTGVASDVRFLDRYAGADSRSERYDAATLRRLQSELSADPAAGAPNAFDAQTPNDALNNTTDNSLNNQALGSDFTTGQQAGGRVQLAPAVRQSEQYRQLQARLDKFNADQGDAAEANRRYNEELRLKNALEDAPRLPTDRMQDRPQNNMPSVPGGNAPGQPAMPGQPGANDSAMQSPPVGAMPVPGRAAQRVERQTVTSLATGVTAKGLSDVLTEAEQLMREQKFVTALGKYDMAEQIAPNNPLVLLGRANAELGASYYARAETHLRQAFTGAPALMMARYDLRQFLGEERLAFLVKDLKEIANNEKTAARPLILLAYIAYNEGNDRMAAGYLDLAEKRVGGGDAFFPAVRKYWELPAYNDAPTIPGS